MKKETKQMVIEVAHLLGMTSGEFVEDAVEHALMPYVSVNGGRMELKPKKGIYLRGASVYEKKVAENEGREAEVIRESCTILQFCEMMGQPYYKIILNGQLMKVPANVIEVIREES